MDAAAPLCPDLDRSSLPSSSRPVGAPRHRVRTGPPAALVRPRTDGRRFGWSKSRAGDATATTGEAVGHRGSPARRDATTGAPRRTGRRGVRVSARRGGRRKEGPSRPDGVTAQGPSCEAAPAVTQHFGRSVRPRGGGFGAPGAEAAPDLNTTWPRNNNPRLPIDAMPCRNGLTGTGR